MYDWNLHDQHYEEGTACIYETIQPKNQALKKEY